jgi:amidase
MQAGKVVEAAEPFSGHWLVTADLHGTPIYGRLDFEQQGQKITGQFYGDKFEGSFDGSAIHFVAKNGSGATRKVDGTLKKGVLSATVVETDGADESHSDRYSFTAIPISQEHRSAPVRHEFAPSVFYREFSALNKPVLSVAPGDSIHTTTIDAAGVDEKSQNRVLGGNPQTGPFLVESAMPGDTLVVHLTRLRLNRDYAISDDGVVGRGTDNYLAVKMKDGGKTVLWHLDIAQGLASLQSRALTWRLTQFPCTRCWAVLRPRRRHRVAHHPRPTQAAMAAIWISMRLSRARQFIFPWQFRGLSYIWAMGMRRREMVS